MIKLDIASVSDAQELLKIQYDAFSKYTDKYGDFDTNPVHMDLCRMEFNIKYRLGKYYKILDDNKIIGGIFIFELDDPTIMQIAQVYLEESYQGKGITSSCLEDIFNIHSGVKVWYVDTILQEKENVSFYESLGFKKLELDEERNGLTFVTFVRK